MSKTLSVHLNTKSKRRRGECNDAALEKVRWFSPHLALHERRRKYPQNPGHFITATPFELSEWTTEEAKEEGAIDPAGYP